MLRPLHMDYKVTFRNQGDENVAEIVLVLLSLFRERLIFDTKVTT